MYGPVLLLHASLILRVAVGDGRGVTWAWQAGGVLNILAVLAFVAVAGWSATTARAASPPARRVTRPVPRGHPMSRPTVSRAAWHLRAGALVAGWLTALLVVTLVHPFVPAWDWLLVHLLVLGAASTAILIWSWHFTAAVLRMPDSVTRRGQVARLAGFTGGAVTVVAGMMTGLWTLLLAGGLLVAATAGWHAWSLLQRLRRALPSRFGVTVRFYIAAGLLLPLGVALGVAMGHGDLPDALHARFLVAHALLNLLGWIGLTVIGTLVTLWPTMLRTRIADRAERTARRILPVLLVGLGVAAGGALSGLLLLTAGGVLIYLAGVLVAGAPHVDEARRKAPVEFSTASVLAGMTWLAGCLILLAASIGTATDWTQAADRVGWVTVPLLAGFVAQVLLGSLTYLLPVVLGGGPSLVRATSAVLGRGAAAAGDRGQRRAAGVCAPGAEPGPGAGVHGRTGGVGIVPAAAPAGGADRPPTPGPAAIDNHVGIESARAAAGRSRGRRSRRGPAGGRRRGSPRPDGRRGRPRVRRGRRGHRNRQHHHRAGQHPGQAIRARRHRRAGR